LPDRSAWFVGKLYGCFFFLAQGGNEEVMFLVTPEIVRTPSMASVGADIGTELGDTKVFLQQQRAFSSMAPDVLHYGNPSNLGINDDENSPLRRSWQSQRRGTLSASENLSLTRGVSSVRSRTAAPQNGGVQHRTFSSRQTGTANRAPDQRQLPAAEPAKTKLADVAHTSVEHLSEPPPQRPIVQDVTRPGAAPLRANYPSAPSGPANNSKPAHRTTTAKPPGTSAQSFKTKIQVTEVPAYRNSPQSADAYRTAGR
jgi:hypothetical protein